MANPFFMQNSNPTSQLHNIYKLMTQSNNPMQAFSELASTNPNMKPIIDLLHKGANPKDIFNDLCKQRGINPNEFINSITGNNT